MSPGAGAVIKRLGLTFENPLTYDDKRSPVGILRS